jgi:hypothetical protein
MAVLWLDATPQDRRAGRLRSPGCPRSEKSGRETSSLAERFEMLKRSPSELLDAWLEGRGLSVAGYVPATKPDQVESDGVAGCGKREQDTGASAARRESVAEDDRQQ